MAVPTPAAMAGAGDDFYRDVARAGYRGPRLQAIAAAVADTELDLEERGYEWVEDEVEGGSLFGRNGSVRIRHGGPSLLSGWRKPPP